MLLLLPLASPKYQPRCARRQIGTGSAAQGNKAQLLEPLCLLAAAASLVTLIPCEVAKQGQGQGSNCRCRWVGQMSSLE